MRVLPRAAVLAALFAFCLSAQAVRIYSEFQRVEPDGTIVQPDRGPRSREILSPALVRNGFTSFHVVVSPPPGRPYWLMLVQNPEGILKLTLYKEKFTQQGGSWIPDALEPVPLEYSSRVDVPGIHESFWLDVWTPAEAPVQRIRIEAQFNAGEDWTIAPMETRVLPAVVRGEGPEAPLAALDAPADATAINVLRSYLCGVGLSPRGASAPPSPLSERSLSLRNARQDMALAKQIAAAGTRDVPRSILAASGAPDPPSWCRTPAAPSGAGAEWYLRVRDYLYRAAGALEERMLQ